MSSDPREPLNEDNAGAESSNPFRDAKISMGAPDRVGADNADQWAANSNSEGDCFEQDVLDDRSNEPTWLHPLSLIFDIIAHGRTYLVPAAFAVLGAANGETLYVYLAALVFIPTLLVSIVRYFTLRYALVDGELRVMSGLFFRNMRAVPVSRIQNVDLVQNVLHRIFGVAEVKVETASGTEPEAVLRVLSMKQIEELREGIFSSRDILQTTTNGSLDEALDPRVDESGEASASVGFAGVSEQTLLKIPLNWLIRAGLASNRGMILLGVLVGLFFQFNGEDYIKRYRLDELLDVLPADWGFAAKASSIVGVVLAILVVFRLVGVFWFILRFYQYKLVRRGEDLRVSCGLFTKVSATVPLRRIQFISVHQNLMMRWFGLASIRIETAGGAATDSEDAAAIVSRRWFVPVISAHRVPEIIQVLRSDLDWNPGALDWKPLADRAGTRMMRVAVVLSVIIGGIGLYISQPWGWVPGALLVPFCIFYALKKSRGMRYARTDYGIVYRSGILTHKTSVTFFERIQTLTVQQSPFDRRWKMACLTIDTAAAGPADHRISIPYLDETFANAEYDLIVERAARHQPLFG